VIGGGVNAPFAIPQDPPLLGYGTSD